MRNGTEEDANQLRANLVKLASNSLELGVLHEPRAFFDIITLNTDGSISPGHGEVFKNGEQFPIRLTHLTAALNFETNDEEPEETDERQIQRVGMRMQFHNQWYMNPQFLPIPIWGNKPVAAPPQVSFGTSAWDFDVPFVLSSRDSMIVEVQLGETPASARQVTVAFEGIGLTSGRVYKIGTTREVSDATRTTLSTLSFRNDGSEAIVLSKGAVNVSAEADDADPTGDIRVLNINVKQVGNGTNASWFQGPITIGSDLMPAPLWGITSGRAVVHRFPGDGLIWEPGEGIGLELLGLTDDPPNVDVHVGLSGYITIV